MTQSPRSRTDSPAIREAKRSAARTAYISVLVMIGLIGVWNGLELVSDLRHGRDVTWTCFSLFILLVAAGLIVSRRRQELRRQGADTADPSASSG